MESGREQENRKTPRNSPLFSSPRERRLWLWTAAVVVAIFSTLALNQKLTVALGGTGFDAILFVVGSLLVLATVVTQGLRARPGGVEIVVALGVAAAYLMVLVRMASPVERSHIVEYGVVAIFIYEALAERARQGRRVPSPPLLAMFAASMIGVVDEGVQHFLPSRVYDPIDILFNTLAAVMAVLGSLALGWARRRRAGPAEPS